MKKWLLFILCFTLTACQPKSTGLIQGYVEGEYVYVAAPNSGRLEKLAVARGQHVKADNELFSLTHVSESTARDEAARRLAQTRAVLEDAKKGRRPTEVESLEAQLSQAKAALTLAKQTLTRQEQLAKTGANSIDDLDKARSSFDQSQQKVTQLDAELKTAALGLRPDQIISAEEEVKAREAALARADWDLSQKTQKAQQDALVFDTLYRQGEWIASGKPVVVLLPPENIKVRAFIPEARIAALHQGDKIAVSFDGMDGAIEGKVNYISPQAEYTPPVIYSKENRDKLVFMIEIVFDPSVASKLHPGQPVDVHLHP